MKKDTEKQNELPKPENDTIQPEKPKVIERPTTEELPIDLTKDELVAYAQESARLNADVASLEVRKKNTASKFKSEIDGIKARISELSDRISSGTERREVPCIWRYDFEKGFKSLIYPAPDEDKIIRNVQISVEERQMQLPIKETIADKVAKAKDAKDEKHNELVDEKAEQAAESVNEKAIRVWFNGLDKNHRAAVCGVATESMELPAFADLLNRPYRHMNQGDKQLVQEAFKNRDKMPHVEETITANEAIQ